MNVALLIMATDSSDPQYVKVIVFSSMRISDCSSVCCH
jgi:hypothetical protein